MGQTESSSKTGVAQSVTYPNDASRRIQIKAQIVQNVLLIWLDANIDENNKDHQNTIVHLRHIVNTVNTFINDEECIEFLKEMADEKVCMIVSGSLGQQIISRIHSLSQVDSIFIFCRDRKYHETWVKGWSKIKGVFTEIGPICDALKQAAQQCEQNAISISIINTYDSVEEKNRDGLDPSFMYTQIMKDIFLTINFGQQHIDDFIKYCQQMLAGNEKQLEHVNRLTCKYQEHTPIWWYTCECFLYPMLNRALRTMDVDLMIKLGFFIVDLHRHIQQLHQKHYGSHCSYQRFTVYRGQGMDKEAFQKMIANKHGLISFNSFLSTSEKRAMALKFAQRALTNAEMVGVLFVMNIDPDQSSIPFASVTDVGHFGAQEGEVLFSMHTVFRIEEIITLKEDTRLVQVQLNIASDKDSDLHKLIDHIRKETFPKEEGWYRLGSILRKMGQPTKAQQVYEILLRQAADESVKAPIYNQLGTIKAQLSEYTEAIEYYKKSIEIEEKLKPIRDQNLAASYNNIGLIYKNMGKYSKALSSHEKALDIRIKSLYSTHPDLATSYNNIGLVYESMADHLKALSSYEEALAIKQQSLPSTHPSLAMTYNNIGSVYYGMGNYPKALLFHKKALTIRQQALPPTHPDLATSYNNIGNVYKRMGDYSEARSSHEKALEIRQKALPPNHPDLATSYDNIGIIYASMGDYSKALSFTEKALVIGQQSLPPTHPDLATFYNSIGNVYKKMGDYSKALSSHERALAIRQQSLSPNHPDLATSFNNIGNVHFRMRDYQKALLFYERALIIKKKSLPSTHPSLAATYGNMGLVYKDMNNYSEACSWFEHAVDVGQHSLPANHPELRLYRSNLADIKNKR